MPSESVGEMDAIRVSALMGIVGSFVLAISIAFTEYWGLAGAVLAILSWLVSRRYGSGTRRHSGLSRAALISGCLFGVLLVMSAVPTIDPRWLIFVAALCGGPWVFLALASRGRSSDD